MVKKSKVKFYQKIYVMNFFEELKSNQIDIDKVYTLLLQDGLSAFKVSFEELLKKVKL